MSHGHTNCLNIGVFHSMTLSHILTARCWHRRSDSMLSMRSRHLLLQYSILVQYQCAVPNIDTRCCATVCLCRYIHVFRVSVRVFHAGAAWYLTFGPTLSYGCICCSTALRHCQRSFARDGFHSSAQAIGRTTPLTAQYCLVHVLPARPFGRLEHNGRGCLHDVHTILIMSKYRVWTPYSVVE